MLRLMTMFVKKKKKDKHSERKYTQRDQLGVIPKYFSFYLKMCCILRKPETRAIVIKLNACGTRLQKKMSE